MTIQTMWGWEPAIYLFLGGLAGGTFFISALVRLATKDRFQRLRGFGSRLVLPGH